MPGIAFRRVTLIPSARGSRFNERQFPQQPIGTKLLSPGADHEIGLTAGAAPGSRVFDELLSGLDPPFCIVVFALYVSLRGRCIMLFAIANESASGTPNKAKQMIDLACYIGP